MSSSHHLFYLQSLWIKTTSASGLAATGNSLTKTKFIIWDRLISWSRKYVPLYAGSWTSPAVLSRTPRWRDPPVCSDHCAQLHRCIWTFVATKQTLSLHVYQVAVGERIAYWIRTPQVPSSRPGWYGTFYWASDCWPLWQHHIERSLVCVEGRGRISRSGLTQDIKMGSCVFQCDVPHQWIAQRQVGPMSVYCDGVGCHALCLQHGISVWQHIGQSTTTTSRHRRDMTSDVSKRR